MDKLDKINDTLKILVNHIEEKKASDIISKIYDKVNNQEKILERHSVILKSLPELTNRIDKIEKQQITWKGIIVGATGIGTIMGGGIMAIINYLKGGN